ncbi:unnamed protein product [Penicillium salamii]|uniref:NAD-dependent epimerase/dehydratase domain-containing protein n=1 Tax=Penicillium salamii TaxID=1612424 RepID=A0A9W4J133_9EURO|nr:unnamed protein product [Penicillium salamii]CAG8363010.1 unnamed protein product [Penicillium salamii]CAG8365729.1 unnamed protein product [Penicillium salamii]CAG8385625.1 unnamed protein product [Penicillium salamii]
MSSIFITGVTGFIGGDVLYGLTQTLAASKIVALVRNQSQAAAVTGRFPTVTPLLGDLDSSVEIQQAASQADVVLHLASSSHEASAKAIADGINNSKQQHPTWIQIAGASMLAGSEVQSKTFGQPGSRVYNDLQGISEIHDIIGNSPKRVVDHLVRGLGSSNPNARTAIVYGPLIYGKGRGPVNQRSIQIPHLAQASLKAGRGLRVGRGLNTWNTIHIADLTNLFVKLACEASKPKNQQLWNENGVYFAESGKIAFGDIAKKISTFAHSQGFMKSPGVAEIDATTADRLTPHGSVIWGTNAQYQAIRARELLGWFPQAHGIDEEIPRVVSSEAASYQARPAEKLV